MKEEAVIKLQDSVLNQTQERNREGIRKRGNNNI